MFSNDIRIMSLLADRSRVQEKIETNKRLLKTDIGQANFVLILKKIAELDNEMTNVDIKIKAII